MNMSKNQEIIARALEIAIQLTDTKRIWLDSDGNVHMSEPLFNKLQAVISIIHAKNLENFIRLSESKEIVVLSDKKK